MCGCSGPRLSHRGTAGWTGTIGVLSTTAPGSRAAFSSQRTMSISAWFAGVSRVALAGCPAVGGMPDALARAGVASSRSESEDDGETGWMLDIVARSCDCGKGWPNAKVEPLRRGCALPPLDFPAGRSVAGGTGELQPSPMPRGTWYKPWYSIKRPPARHARACRHFPDSR